MRACTSECVSVWVSRASERVCGTAKRLGRRFVSFFLTCVATERRGGVPGFKRALGGSSDRVIRDHPRDLSGRGRRKKRKSEKVKEKWEGRKENKL